MILHRPVLHLCEDKFVYLIFNTYYIWDAELQTHFIYIYNNRFCNNDMYFPDEKEKYDPSAFRNAIIQGLDEAGNDLDQVIWIALKKLLVLMTIASKATDWLWKDMLPAVKLNSSLFISMN